MGNIRPARYAFTYGNVIYDLSLKNSEGQLAFSVLYPGGGSQSRNWEIEMPKGKKNIRIRFFSADIEHIKKLGYKNIKTIPPGI